LAATGPRTAAEPQGYSLVVEAIREGYELHYGTPRILAGQDDDLALLAGDYLYAHGLSLLAAIGDAEAVAELADLISLCADAHTAGVAEMPALWLAAVVAIAAGTGPPHAAAKASLRAGAPVGAELWRWSSFVASQTGLDEQLGAAAEAVGFAR
jgi:hypothetical protein